MTQKRMTLSSTSSVSNVKRITTELPKVRFKVKNVNLLKSVRSSLVLKKKKNLLQVKLQSYVTNFQLLQQSSTTSAHMFLQSTLFLQKKCNDLMPRKRSLLQPRSVSGKNLPPNSNLSKLIKWLRGNSRSQRRCVMKLRKRSVKKKINFSKNLKNSLNLELSKLILSEIFLVLYQLAATCKPTSQNLRLKRHASRNCSTTQISTFNKWRERSPELKVNAVKRNFRS